MTNIQSANLPFLALQSKKNFSGNQNSNNKIPLSNVSAKVSKYLNLIIDVPYSTEVSPRSKAAKTNITNISSVKVEKAVEKGIDESAGDEEYKQCLKKALTEAMNENDFVRWLYNIIAKRRNKESQREK